MKANGKSSISWKREYSFGLEQIKMKPLRMQVGEYYARFIGALFTEAGRIHNTHDESTRLRRGQ